MADKIHTTGKQASLGDLVHVFNVPGIACYLDKETGYINSIAKVIGIDGKSVLAKFYDDEHWWMDASDYSIIYET